MAIHSQMALIPGHAFCISWSLFMLRLPLIFAQMTYPSPNRLYVCLSCQPGFHVVTHCMTMLTNSTCRQCPDGTFADTVNSRTYCSKCTFRYCPKNAITIQKCTSTTDSQCRCQEGFYMTSIDDFDSFTECTRHSKCSSLEGELYPGNFSSNVVCRACVDTQEFIDLSDPDHPKCTPCSRCPKDVSELAQCTLQEDTKCAFLGSDALVGIIIGTFMLVIVSTGIIAVIVWKQKKKSSMKRITEGETGECLAAQNENNNIVKETEETSVHTSDNRDEKKSLLKWSRSFIQRDIFSQLSRGLGGDWSDFIRHLPGLKEATSLIEQAQENQRDVKQQILFCLRIWAKENPKSVTRANILRTLEDIKNIELKEKLEEIREKT